jgi:hypothetical protein
VLLLDQLGLQQFELHAHRAQFVAQQEVGVGEGQAVGALGPVVARGRRLSGGVLFGAGKVAGGELGASRLSMGRELTRCA